MAVRIVPALSDRRVVDTPVYALEVMLETSNKRINTSESQVGPKDIEIAAKVAQGDNLEKHDRIAEEEASLLWGTTSEHCPQLSSAKAACSNAEVALQSAGLNFKTCARLNRHYRRR